MRLLLWMLIGVLSKPLHAQLEELDAALTEQVNSGWLSGQERLRILDHVVQTGFPIAIEEAWAIEGLTHGAARALMQSQAWQHLVQEVHHTTRHRSPSAEVRFGRGQALHSIRMRNPGKWGVRWDREAELLSGYMQMPVGQRGRWQALAGGHRLGWGNRTLMGEGALFAGLDAPSFALPVQYGFAPMWGPAVQGARNGVALHRDGPVAATLSLDARARDVAAVVSREGWTGLIAHYSGKQPAVTVFAQRFSGMRHWISEAGRVRDGWAWSGACQWVYNRHSEARMRFEAFKPVGSTQLEWEASAGGEWEAFDCRMRWHASWSNQDEVHPLWVKCRREWPEGKAIEVHWRAAQTEGPDARSSQRLEFRGHWKSDPLVLRFTIVPFADEGGPGASSAFISHRFGTWRFKQSVTVWTLDTGRRAYIPEPSWTGTSYRMISGSGYRLVSVLQRKHPSGWTWLASIVRSNRPAEGEISANMLTLTSAQTELSLSIRMSL